MCFVLGCKHCCQGRASPEVLRSEFLWDHLRAGPGGRSSDHTHSQPLGGFCQRQELSLLLRPWEAGGGKWATAKPWGLHGLLGSRAGTREKPPFLLSRQWASCKLKPVILTESLTASLKLYQ